MKYNVPLANTLTTVVVSFYSTKNVKQIME